MGPEFPFAASIHRGSESQDNFSVPMQAYADSPWLSYRELSIEFSLHEAVRRLNRTIKPNPANLSDIASLLPEALRRSRPSPHQLNFFLLPHRLISSFHNSSFLSIPPRFISKLLRRFNRHNVLRSVRRPPGREFHASIGN